MSRTGLSPSQFQPGTPPLSHLAASLVGVVAEFDAIVGDGHLDHRAHRQRCDARRREKTFGPVGEIAADLDERNDSQSSSAAASNPLNA